MELNPNATLDRIANGVHSIHAIHHAFQDFLVHA
jgi:hypothetical protein